MDPRQPSNGPDPAVPPEQKVRIAHEELDLVLDAAQLGIFDIDIASDTTRRNLRHDQIFGHATLLPRWGVAATRAQLLPEYLERFDAAREQALRSGRYDVTAPIYWPDGSIHWFQDMGRVYYDAQGKPARIVGITLDITERKQAEEALTDSRKRLSLALRAGRMCAWEWDIEKQQMLASESAAAILGREPHNLADVFSGAPELERALRRAELESALGAHAGDYRSEFEITLPDGQGNRWLETRALAEEIGGRVVRVLGVTTDITPRKQAEVEAAENEERFALALAAGRMDAWEWNIVDGRLWLSDSFGRFTGDRALEGFDDLQALIHPSDWRTLEEAFQQALATHNTVRVELRLTDAADGATRWVEVRGSTRQDSAGHIVGLSGLVMDISARKLAEGERRVADERLRLVMESIPEFAILALDSGGWITGWSRGAAEIFGYRDDEAIGQSFAILFTPEDRESGAPDRELERAAGQGSASDNRWHLRKDGSRIYVNGVVLAVRPDRVAETSIGFIKVIHSVAEPGEAQA